MSSEWQLADPLLRDSVLLEIQDGVQIRLMNQQDFPWWVLVPMVEGASEFFDLSEDQQQRLCRLINRCSQSLKQLTGCDKINVAWLGNQVSQLHIHIIARFEGDLAWPGVVFGWPAHPYEPEELQQVLEFFRSAHSEGERHGD
jgi:diadenosine tetraphosphate (Ap4A) HIT family hydrolase